MNLTVFASQVAEMRTAQKEYFRDRTSHALARSKRLERAVDQTVRAVLDQREVQGRLLEEELEEAQ